MKKKLGILFALVLAVSLMLVPAAVSANPGIGFNTVGSGTAKWSNEQVHNGNYSAKLYVANGGADWAEVSIPVDIALKDITELKFWEYIASYAPKGWSVNVILGIDADNDGVFEADVAEWHVGSGAWTLPALNGDTFVEMDGAFGNPATGAWTGTNALSIAQWWTPDKSGASFAKADTYPDTFYGSFANLINVFIPDPTQTSLIPNVNARVLCVKLVIGGAGSWMDETAYVDDINMNGVIYKLEPGSGVGTAVNIPEIISVSVTPTFVNFGPMLPGDDSGPRGLYITNTGTVWIDITTELSPTGTVFDDNLWLPFGTNTLAKDFVLNGLVGGAMHQVNAQLVIPRAYEAVGLETATLIFWATASP